MQEMMEDWISKMVSFESPVYYDITALHNTVAPL